MSESNSLPSHLPTFVCGLKPLYHARVQWLEEKRRKKKHMMVWKSACMTCKRHKKQSTPHIAAALKKHEPCIAYFSLHSKVIKIRQPGYRKLLTGWEYVVHIAFIAAVYSGGGLMNQQRWIYYSHSVNVINAISSCWMSDRWGDC